MQNEYCECADLILSHYPDQIDHLLALVFSEKIAEAKMQQLLNHLSKNSVQLLSRILSKLASNTCLAGMELLRYVVITLPTQQVRHLPKLMSSTLKFTIPNFKTRHLQCMHNIT